MNPDDILADETAIVIDEALHAARIMLAGNHDTHTGAELAAAARLIDHLRDRLPDLVADARDQDHSWAEIGRLLRSSRLRAMARYRHHARTRPHPANLD